MGISLETVRFLADLEYDAIHLNEQSLHRMPDPDILQKALNESRILLTHDLGFGDLLASSGFHQPSVIIFRLHDMRPSSVNLHLAIAIDEFRTALEDGAIISVTEGSIRSRRLPI